jgi:rod shape-determining protein MreD
MIITRQIGVRLALLAFFGVILQLAFFSRVSFLGTSPDVTPVIVLCLGLLGGSLAGAVAGFSIGLLLDTLQYQTLGASSLSLILVGYLAGRYREAFDISSPFAVPALAAVLTLVGVLSFSLIQLMLGVQADVSALVLRDTLLKVIYNALLATPIYALIRRVLRPALIEDAPRGGGRRGRRRRAKRDTEEAGGATIDAMPASTGEPAVS